MVATFPIEILPVEDNTGGDTRFILEAFKDIAMLIRVSVVCDGEETLGFLRQQGPNAFSPRPNLVLLDLSRPRKDGREVLQEIKCYRELEVIPVIILTTSAAEADIAKSDDLHANCYIQKPADYDAFVEPIRGLERFWLELVELPITIEESAA